MRNFRLPYCSVQIIINRGKQKEKPVYQQVDDADKQVQGFRCIYVERKKCTIGA